MDLDMGGEKRLHWKSSKLSPGRYGEMVHQDDRENAQDGDYIRRTKEVEKRSPNKDRKSRESNKDREQDGSGS